MQKSKPLIAMIILAILVVPMTTQLAPAQAATTLDIPVYLKVHAEPTPVGVGQPVYISMFFTKPIPIPGSAFGGNYYTDMSLNIVKPDGTNVTLGPYTSDTTGGVGGIEFTPTVSGNYTVQAFYKGQTLTASNGDKYNILLTQSEPDTFTVQDDPIPGRALVPLPTEYWSRPIYATNYQWSQLGGNWWGLGKPSFTDTGGYDAQGNNFNPYSEAPNTGHIMWVKPAMFGGQVGGPVSGDQESAYTTTSILYRQFEPIILNGIIYYKAYTNTPTTETSAETPGWNAVDLRTGELIWHKDTKDTLDFGMVMQFHTIQEYGTQAYLVASSKSPSMFSTGTGDWQLFDPMTGYFIANITGVPATTASGLVETRNSNPQGTVYIYAITNGNLTMWNSTLCLAGPTGGSTIRPSGNIAYSRGIQWQVRAPTNLTINGVTTNISDGTLKNPALSIGAQTNDVIVLRAYGEAIDTFAQEFGESSEIEAGFNATNGALLWGPVNRTIPRFHEIGVVAAGDGYYVEHDKDTNQAYIFNINTGAQVGSAVQLPGSALSTLSRAGAIAYGKCYIWDFGGYVNAIDLATGTVSWTYVPESAGYDTPYGVYPIWHFGTHSLADGKLFLSQGRMYDPPMFAGAKKLAINCTDGSVVWSILGTFAREPSAIADGYMVGFNSFDGQIYSFGKGPTQTTANVNVDVVAADSSVMITGTVLDKSAGTTDNDRTARFPNGVAAVSDASQSAWMEYVYMQQPQPTNATGVTVELFVVDANGNYRSIGTTATDTNGFYSYNWCPDISGKYTVYAVFSGSESYWGSQATTAFAVNPAAAATPAPTDTPVGIADAYFLPAVAGIIIVIAIIGALIMVMLRKK